jgi:hypothetical protein
MKFEFLGYYVEYSRFSKRWLVLDWDYETEPYVVANLPSKSAAMDWIVGRSL